MVLGLSPVEVTFCSYISIAVSVKGEFLVFFDGRSSTSFRDCVGANFSVTELENRYQFSTASGPYYGVRVNMT